jgi:hypothetical protein
METGTEADIFDRIRKLHQETDSLGKAGTVVGIASIAGTIAAGMIFPPLAAAVGLVASGAAAALLYRKIKDQRELASLRGADEKSAANQKLELAE